MHRNYEKQNIIKLLNTIGYILNFIVSMHLSSYLIMHLSSYLIMHLSSYLTIQLSILLCSYLSYYTAIYLTMQQSIQLSTLIIEDNPGFILLWISKDSSYKSVLFPFIIRTSNLKEYFHINL